MPNLNKVMLMGNLTRDPEIRYTPKGLAVCQIGLAVSYNWTTADGEKKEDVTFIDIEWFGKQAEVIGKHFHKGYPIFVEGRLKLDQWDDKTTGQKRTKIKVIGEGFQFLRQKGAEDTGSHGGQGEGQGHTQRTQRPAGGRAAPPPRPPVDPGLDLAAEDDIPF